MSCVYFQVYAVNQVNPCRDGGEKAMYTLWSALLHAPRTHADLRPGENDFSVGWMKNLRMFKIVAGNMLTSVYPNTIIFTYVLSKLHLLFAVYCRRSNYLGSGKYPSNQTKQRARDRHEKNRINMEILYARRKGGTSDPSMVKSPTTSCCAGSRTEGTPQAGETAEPYDVELHEEFS